MTTNYQHRYPRIEKLLAVASFLSADGMGFLAFMLSENHDIETGPLWFIAQISQITLISQIGIAVL